MRGGLSVSAWGRSTRRPPLSPAGVGLRRDGELLAVLGFTVVALGMSPHARSLEGGTAPGGPFPWAALWIRSSSPKPPAAGCCGEIGINVTRSALGLSEASSQGSSPPLGLLLGFPLYSGHSLAGIFCYLCCPFPTWRFTPGGQEAAVHCFLLIVWGLQKYSE